MARKPRKLVIALLSLGWRRCCRCYSYGHFARQAQGAAIPETIAAALDRVIAAMAKARSAENGLALPGENLDAFAIRPWRRAKPGAAYLHLARRPDRQDARLAVRSAFRRKRRALMSARE
ncbi:MAG: hypothetical protein LBL59_05490 [Xanthomonadaceae bacterium]|jgi:hypothetical protein|nr:hypothetical protein [Xanthomonadaceae bacterium]